MFKLVGLVTGVTDYRYGIVVFNVPLDTL